MHNRVSLVVLAVLGMASGVWAQDKSVESGAATPSKAPVVNDQAEANGATYTLSAGGSYQFDTDFTDSGGKFAVTRWGVGASVKYPISNSALTLDNVFSYEQSAYDFDHKPAPWNQVDSFAYTLKIDYKLDDNWTIFGGPMAGISVANGASWGSAWWAGGMLGASYRVNADLKIGGGVAIIDNIGNEAGVLPILLLDWRITDELSLKNARPQPGVPGGLGIELVWKATEKIDLAAGAAFERSRFRIEDQGGQHDLIGKDESVPVYIRCDYRPAPAWTLSGFAGVAFGGKMEVLYNNGDTLTSQDYDPAPFVGLAVCWKR